MNRVIKFWDLQKHLAELMSSFKPNNEYGAPKYDARKVQHLDMVDLSQSVAGSIVFAAGHHGSASYVLRVDDAKQGRIVNIWRDPDANGFVAPIESMVSYVRPKFVEDIAAEIDEYETGVIRLKSHFTMPYFRYEQIDGKKSVKRDGAWNDAWLALVLQTP